ncbi:hypothetical protein NLG97_g7838 [Lecanicillium saksenae]|uniref:Uncharacterized protein n=1 Tax=Lecanicillium saksenae TaxID=468837 RepID=A0ACC1QKR7_9HYPO|nr:hypothetical protein NLG97_g7838 [Lecanicillium saksenae]
MSPPDPPWQPAIFSRAPSPFPAPSIRASTFCTRALSSPEARVLRARIERQRHLLSHLVAHHLNTNPSRITVSGNEYWLHGSFNLCVPVLLDTTGEASLPQYVIIRLPLPYRVGEATHPGNSDEKPRAEAAAYAWIGEKSPDVPITKLHAFGLSTKQRASISEKSAIYVCGKPSVVAALAPVRPPLLLSTLGLEQPSQLGPHHSARLDALDIGYLLIQTIDVETGTMLSASWDERHTDARLQNLQRDIARVMLSLAKTPLPRIGTFCVNDGGSLRLDNRPISVQLALQANEGIFGNKCRRRIFTNVKDFILYHIDNFRNGLLQQPNGISSRSDAYTQMASLVGAAALFPQLFRRELDQGPFVFALTDLHKSNILVDDDWRITAIIDLEFACSWPIEFVQPPYWLGGEMLNEITLECFSQKHEEFIRHVEQEESIGTAGGRVTDDELRVDRKFTARLWRKDIDRIVEAKLQDYEDYNKDLDLLYAKDAI